MIFWGAAYDISVHKSSFSFINLTNALIILEDLNVCSLVAQRLKCLPEMQETWVRSLGWEDPLEKEMAPHCSILGWRIPWTGEPGGLQSMGSQRVRHDWGTSLSLSLSNSMKIHILPDFHCFPTGSFSSQWREYFLWWIEKGNHQRECFWVIWCTFPWLLLTPPSTHSDFLFHFSEM